MENELAQLCTMNKLYRETAENELLLKEQITSLQESLRRCKEERLVIPTLEVTSSLYNIFICIDLKKQPFFTVRVEE